MHSIPIDASHWNFGKSGALPPQSKQKVLHLLLSSREIYSTGYYFKKERLLQDTGKGTICNPLINTGTDEN